MIEKKRYDAGDTAAWLSLRNSLSDKLGGSEVGIAANHSKYSSFLKMLSERVGLVDKPDISGKMAVKLGHWNEEIVAKEFEARSGKTVHRENCIYLNSDFPHLKASIDRKIANEPSGLECKFMSDMTMRAYKRGEFPETYKDQCATYIAVTGLTRWYLAIVTNSRFFCYLMTSDKAEEERYYALAREGADSEEWQRDFAWLDAVYHLDDAEMRGAEIVAAHFIDCVQKVERFVADEEAKAPFPTDKARKAFLANAVCQVVEPFDIDGSADHANQPTKQTLAEMFAEAVKDSSLEIAPGTDDCRELSDLLAERDAILQRQKEDAARKDAIENALRLKMRETETMLLPAWKVVCATAAGRRSCSVPAVENYFSTRGEPVPDGLITAGAPSRSLRVYARKGKTRAA